MAWLETEAENLVAMTCVTPTDGLPVWTLADALVTYLYRGRYDSIWKSAFTSALSAAERFGSPEAQASAHRGIGRLHYQHTDYEAAEEHLTRAVELYRQANDPVNQARALNALVAIAVNRARFTDAVELTNECLRLVEIQSDPAGRHGYLFNRGMLRIHFGQVVEGTAAIDEAMREPSYKVIRAMGLGAFGLRDLWAGDLGSALGHFEQMVTESAAGHAIGLVEAENNIANTALIAGFAELAAALAEHALHTAQQAEWAWAMIGALVLLGNAALALDDLALAEDHFTQARKAAGTAGNYWDASIIRGTSTILRLSGRAAEAAELAATGLKAELPRERSEVHTELAAALLATGDHQGAIEQARQGSLLAEQYGYRLYQINALHTLADAHDTAGDRAAARGARNRATELTEPVPAEFGPTLRRLVAELGSSEED